MLSKLTLATTQTPHPTPNPKPQPEAGMLSGVIDLLRGQHGSVVN